MKMRVTMLTALLVLLTAGLSLAGDRPASLLEADAGMPGCGAERLMCGAILAQGPGQGPGFGGHHGRDRDERRRHLEQLRMLKMLEVLDLDKDQEVEFLTAFRDVREQHRELNAEKEGLVDSLSKIVEADEPDDGIINALVDRVLGIEQQRGEVMEAFIENTRSLLTPQQIGRLLIFTERFERELLEQVKSFRDRKRNFPEPPMGEG